MKKVRLTASVDTAKCIGDRVCENVRPAGAISMIEKRARVGESPVCSVFQVHGYL